MTYDQRVAQSFDMGRVIERTFSAIGQNAASFFTAAALAVGLPTAIMSGGQVLQMQAIQTGALFGPGFLVIFIGWALSLGGSLLLQGLIVKGAVGTFSGRQVPFDRAFDAGLRSILPLLGLAIIVGLGVMLGMVLLIVPGLILMVLWSVAAPALVVENRGVFESLQRSRDLTRGNRWAVFGLLVIYIVLAYIVSFAAGFAGGSIGAIAGGVTGTTIATAIVSTVIAVPLGVVSSAGVAALYFELRTIKEGVRPNDIAAVFE